MPYEIKLAIKTKVAFDEDSSILTVRFFAL